DETLTDANAVLSELIAIREACPDPARLGLIVPGAVGADAADAAAAAVTAAQQAGYQRLIVRSSAAVDNEESGAGEEEMKKGPALAAAKLPVLEFPAAAV
ncbi:MAG: deoxyribose-phosphate aldolase, partial [Corynebacterium sp.]|nr:deoxyribose-phosphate aldolase [Corynebacterium sp.]